MKFCQFLVTILPIFSQISYVIPISGISKFQFFLCCSQIPEPFGPQDFVIISRHQNFKRHSAENFQPLGPPTSVHLPKKKEEFRIDFNNFLLRNVTPSEKLQKIFCQTRYSNIFAYFQLLTYFANFQAIFKRNYFANL